MRPKVPTKELKLTKRKTDGQYWTRWTDENGIRHARLFGDHPRTAEVDFNRFYAKWRRDPSERTPPMRADRPTIAQIWEWFKADRAGDYTPTSRNTSELTNIGHAMAAVIDLFSELPAEDFSPGLFRRVRDSMIRDIDGKQPLCRNTINHRLRRIRSVFKWAAGHDHVPPSVWHGLQTVEALNRKSKARESEEVPPVSDVWVEQTITHCPTTLAAMIRVQRLTGMRPGEVTIMRACDIDMSGPVWLYAPSRHKLEKANIPRVVPIGPRAQEVITPLLARDVTAYLFSPKESIKQRHAARSGHRRPNQRPNATKTSRKVGDHYTTQAYGYAIRRICEKHGIPHWHPNQLRHTWATEVRKMTGGDLEVIQQQLGHRRRSTTERYAGVDVARAVEVAQKVG